MTFEMQEGYKLLGIVENPAEVFQARGIEYD